MSEISFKATADYAQAQKAVQQHEKDIAKLTAKLTDVAAKSKRASREEQQWHRESKRIKDQAVTAQDRYNQRIKLADALLKRNKITQQEYNLEVKNAKIAMQNAGRAGQAAFGSRAISSLQSMAAGWLSLGAAISFATSALTAMNEARERAKELAKTSEMGMGSLGQLATTKEEYQSLRAAAENLYRTGGAESLDAAARTVFALKSAGAMEDLGLFGELRATGLVESPDIMARSARTLQASMGRGETGDFRDLVSKALGASEYSPATAEALLEGAARSGGLGRALGISDEEILAATAMTATATGSAEMGGTQLASMLAALDKKSGTMVGGKRVDFRGKSLKESLELVQSLGLEGEEQFKFFGRKQALAAYRTMMLNMPEYEEALGSVREAEATDRVGTQLTLPGTVASQAAARRARMAQAEKELSAEQLGTAGNLVDAAMDQYAADVRSGKRKTTLPAEWDIAMTRGAVETRRRFVGDEKILRDLIAHGEISGPETERQAREYFTLQKFGGKGGDETTELLGEIRDELKTANAKPTPIPASAVNAHSE